MIDYFSELLVDGLNVASIKAMKKVKVNLSDRLKERITKASSRFQFGFTGFKGIATCSICHRSVLDFSHKNCEDFRIVSRVSDGLVGQILVAIQVPDKPGRNSGESEAGYAFWYVNVPNGYPNPYAAGERFDINEKLYSAEFREEHLVEMLQIAVDRLCKMLENAY